MRNTSRSETQRILIAEHELADGRRFLRLGVMWKAYDSQEKQIYNASARSSLALTIF